MGTPVSPIMQPSPRSPPGPFGAPNTHRVPDFHAVAAPVDSGHQAGYGHPREEEPAHGIVGCQGAQEPAISASVAAPQEFHSVTAAQSLNADPYNLCAETMALEECMLGVEVRRTWSETEMVRSFGGQMSPGTPDGMFESWDGALTCVQVVRVPLVLGLSVSELQETLAQTVVTKVVKSQRWLAFTQAAPADFVIFCWLPFAVPDDVVEHAEALMLRIRGLDPRFSLRLRTPEEPSALFPALFARNREFCRSKVGLSESDVSTYTGSEALGSDDEDAACEWDITWDWDSLGSPEEEPCGDVSSEGSGTAEEDEAFDWDITWGWDSTVFAEEAPPLCSFEGAVEEDAWTQSGRSTGGSGLAVKSQRLSWDDAG